MGKSTAVIIGLTFCLTGLLLPSYTFAAKKESEKVIDAGAIAQKKKAMDYYARGRAFHSKNEYKKAIYMYKKALSIYPDLPKVKKAIVWAKKDFRRKQVVDSAKLKTLDEIVSKAKFFYTRGQELESKNRILEAGIAYKKALHLIANYPEAKWAYNRVQTQVRRSLIPKGNPLKKKRLAQGEVKQRKHRRKKTSHEEMMAAIKQSNPEDELADGSQSSMHKAVQNHFLTGSQALDNGDYALAIQEFELILEFYPDHRKAVFKLDTAKEKLQEEINATRRQAQVAKSKGDTIGEIRAMRDLAQIDPDNADLQSSWEETKAANKNMVGELYRKGVSLYAKGKYQEALHTWELVLDLNSNHKKTLSSINTVREKLLLISNQEERISTAAEPTPTH